MSDLKRHVLGGKWHKAEGKEQVPGGKGHKAELNGHKDEGTKLESLEFTEGTVIGSSKIAYIIFGTITQELHRAKNQGRRK